MTPLDFATVAAYDESTSSGRGRPPLRLLAESAHEASRRHGHVVSASQEKRGNGTAFATYIVKRESGDKKNPSLDILKKLAKALGVPVTELLE